MGVYCWYLRGCRGGLASWWAKLMNDLEAVVCWFMNWVVGEEGEAGFESEE